MIGRLTTAGLAAGLLWLGWVSTCAAQGDEFNNNTPGGTGTSYGRSYGDLPPQPPGEGWEWTRDPNVEGLHMRWCRMVPYAIVCMNDDGTEDGQPRRDSNGVFQLGGKGRGSVTPTPDLPGNSNGGLSSQTPGWGRGSPRTGGQRLTSAVQRAATQARASTFITIGGSGPCSYFGTQPIGRSRGQGYETVYICIVGTPGSRYIDNAPLQPVPGMTSGLTSISGTFTNGRPPSFSISGLNGESRLPLVVQLYPAAGGGY